MKQLTFLLTLIISSLLISCSKSASKAGGNCYRCTITGAGSSRTLDTCSQVKSDQYQFHDANGNDQSFFCEEK
jgi:hypothetical protein